MKLSCAFYFLACIVTTFARHMFKIYFAFQVANLACSMSSNEEGIKMVRIAAYQVESLCPQVINAARVLTLRPRSKVALENMDVFKDAWEKQVRLLTEAVDDITTIDDFLAVTGKIFFIFIVSFMSFFLFISDVNSVTK